MSKEAKMKNTYIMIDCTASESNPGHGSCNTKSVAFAHSKAHAKEFILSRDYDYCCQIITRREALELREEGYNNVMGGLNIYTNEIEAFGPQRY